MHFTHTKLIEFLLICALKHRIKMASHMSHYTYHITHITECDMCDQFSYCLMFIWRILIAGK